MSLNAEHMSLQIEEEKNYNIAVLLTCYNRREETLISLGALFDISLPKNFSFTVYLVDDGSTDGTGNAIKQEFPGVNVLKGDGTLFWCGGMNLAFGKALEDGYDFYLWMNDDTILNKDSLKTLLNTYYHLIENEDQEAVIIGSVCDGESQKLTYGGQRRGKWWKPLQYEMIKPNGFPQICDLFHGNCVLIPSKVAEETGNMSVAYQQGPGDIDYARRIRKKGFRAWICPGFIGTCSKNIMIEKWKDKNLSMEERVGALNKPVVVARTKDWVIYTKKYHKLLFPYYWFISLIKLRFPRIYLVVRTLSQN